MPSKLSAKSLKVILGVCILPASVVAAIAIHKILEQCPFPTQLILSGLVLLVVGLAIWIPLLFILKREYDERFQSPAR